ncbi:MAG: succinylglutamate desuccinylase [Chloroflexi bacterium]|nr:succinylglutamate desuccinylase [Chloroflexota bacterium]
MADQAKWIGHKVGTADARPGEMVRGGIPIVADMYGRERLMPVVVACGVEPGPVIWLNGAIHGDEPEGPWSIALVMRQIDPQQLKGVVVAVPAMNVDALTAGTRGDPLDTFTYDMNRVYPGSATGRATERVAYAHYQAMMASADYQIAIHSGGDHSYLSQMIFAPEMPQCLELAAAMGPDFPLVFTSLLKAGDPTSELVKKGGGGITVELGGQCRTLTRDFDTVCQTLARSMLNVLRHFGMIPGQAHYCRSWKRGHQVALLANATGLWIGDPGLEFHREMAKGAALGQIVNLYGDVSETVVAPADGLVFGLRHRPQVRVGDWICFYGVVDEIRDNLLPR